MPPRPRRVALVLAAAATLGPARATAAAAEPAPKASKPDPKTSKPETAKKPDPRSSKTDPRKPDPRAGKPDAADAKSSKPETDAVDARSGKPTLARTDAKRSDPKASKTDPKRSDPKQPDPKASKPDGKQTDPKPGKQPDPKASKPDGKKTDPKPGKQPDPKASKPDGKQTDPKPGKPDAEQPDPKASKPEPAPPAPAAPAPAASAGYWLAAQLLGPDDAQAAARRQLAADLGAAPDAAGMLGTAPALPDAVRWLARWVFAGDPLPPLAAAPADSPLYEGPVPRPGGALLTAHGVVAHAFTIKGRSADGGTREIRWPQTAAEIVPPGLAWTSGVLLADRAPLFAAPAARVPPAGERYAQVRRSGSLFILGYADRCTGATGERVCLRWAQVVAREGDDFRGGYLPAFQVARVDGWVRGAGQNPRVQVLAAGTAGKTAQFVLVARTRDGQLHRRTLLTPLVGDAYPAARVRVDGDWATVEFSGAPPQRHALDASLDARVR